MPRLVLVALASVAAVACAGNVRSDAASRQFLLSRTVYVLGCGTGWVWNDKFIITNAHVGQCVKDMHTGVATVVFSSGAAYTATVAGMATQEFVDLAVLEFRARVNMGAFHIIEDGGHLSPGTTVMSMGNPAPSTWLATRYRVLAQPERVDGGLDGVIVLEGRALEGDSGSPVVTEDGKVVGVLFAKRGNIAYAVPVRPYVVDLLREVRPTAMFRAEHFKW
ncbi:MAG TPA: serine protease [Haliangiales bacterium]|nr:serine protease [Haliangiales bacterium]